MSGRTSFCDEAESHVIQATMKNICRFKYIAYFNSVHKYMTFRFLLNGILLTLLQNEYESKDSTVFFIGENVLHFLKNTMSCT